MARNTRSHLPALVFVLLAPLTMTEARAGNGAKPRVPPSFPHTPCAIDVDRSRDARWSFDVGIPFEDIDLGAEEPADGRSFQFFALCRDLEPGEELPSWISRDDVERARAADPSIPAPTDEDVLETASAWQPGPDGTPCAIPITSAQERRPISCDGTRTPIEVDTRSWPPGTYVIWGYTFEPPNSLWTRRPGIVRVRDAEPSGPAVWLSWPRTDATIYSDAGVEIEGCVLGDSTTSVELSWTTASALAKDSPTWTSFARWSPTSSDEAFTIAFTPPPEATFEALYFRARAVDDDGAGFVTSSLEPTVVLPGCEAPEEGDRAASDFCAVAEADPGLEPRAARDCDNASTPEEGSTGSPEPENGDSEAPETEEPDERPPEDDPSGNPHDEISGCQTAHSSTRETVILLLFLVASARSRSYRLGSIRQ